MTLNEDIISVLCILVAFLVLACCYIFFGHRKISKPREVEISEISTQRITLKWKPPLRGHECVKSYTILSKSEDTSWQVGWTTREERVTINLHRLEKNVIHSFKIRPESDTGHGEESDLIDTSRKIPGKIKDKPFASCIYADFLNLEWDLPAHGAELVKGYTLYYRPVHQHSEWKEIKSKGSERCILVDDLDPQTTYHFQVCPYGILGSGPKSDVCKVTTSKSLPTQLKEMSILRGEKNSLEIYSLPLTRYREGQYTCYIDKLSYESPRKKVLMLVGETGSGKTTLLNAIANYIFGVGMEGNFRFKVDVDRTDIPQAHSQTSHINTYTFYPIVGSRLPYQLVIVDTPGFSDTRGYINDKQLVREIEAFFKADNHCIDHIDGVGFVIRSSCSRLTTAQRYVFNAILNVFGKNIAKSIFWMITFADHQIPPVLEVIRKAKVPYNGSHFKFNNSSLFAKPTKNQKMFWDMCMKNFENFFSDFKELTSVSLQMTKENLEKRHRLEEQLHHLLPVIELGLNQHHELKQKEKSLEVYESRKNHNKNFATTVIKNKRKIVFTNSSSLNCTECRYTCHFLCNEVKNDDEQNKCMNMDHPGKTDAHCTICISKCSWKVHKLQRICYEYESQKTIIVSDPSKKERYDAAHEGSVRLKMDIEQLKRRCSEVEEDVRTKIMQAKKYQNRLNKISLGHSSDLNESQYIDTLIESEKEEQKEGYQQRMDTLVEYKRVLLVHHTIKTSDCTGAVRSLLTSRTSNNSSDTANTSIETSTTPFRRSGRNRKQPNQ